MASFPTTIKTFATRSAGQAIGSQHINDLQDEVNAMETAALTVGTWTPVIGGSGGTSGQTYGTQVGRYVKFGRLVHVQAYVQLSTKGTITSGVQIQGLPATALNTSNAYASLHVEWFTLATNWNYISAEIQPNTTAASLFGVQAAAASLSALATADILNNSQFIITGTYIADS